MVSLNPMPTMKEVLFVKEGSFWWRDLPAALGHFLRLGFVFFFKMEGLVNCGMTYGRTNC
jgi:hypothetical protein